MVDIIWLRLDSAKHTDSAILPPKISLQISISHRRYHVGQLRTIQTACVVAQPFDWCTLGRRGTRTHHHRNASGCTVHGVPLQNPGYVSG